MVNLRKHSTRFDCTQRRLVLCWVCFVLVILSSLAIVEAQTINTIPDNQYGCVDTRYLLNRAITPYDLNIKTSNITTAGSYDAEMAIGEYSHFYLLNVVPPLGNETTTIDLNFESVSGEAPLEYALFLGMDILTDGYQPVNTDATLNRQIVGAGQYTLVTRHQSVQNVDSASVSYRFNIDFSASDALIQPEIRDEFIGRSVDPSLLTLDGIQTIQLSATDIRLHAQSTQSVASSDGQASQVFFTEGTLRVGAWADTINLLGGDLALRGVAQNGDDFNERILYVEDFGYQVENINEALTVLTGTDNTSINIDWRDVRGVWMLDECVGMLLRDGRTFTAPVVAGQRQATFSGTVDAFSLRVITPDHQAQPVLHSVDMNWAGIVDDSEVQIRDGVFHANLIEDRRISLLGTSISFTRDVIEGETLTANTPLRVNLSARQINVVLDWVNMRRFDLQLDSLIIDFIDEPRGTVTRNAVNLRTFEALDDVIRIIYAPETEGQRGEERLILPASESYIELITPAGLPFYDPLAKPHQDGYMPRGLNNLGGECYPVNTLLPEANCPPNGHINPANGNLWFAVIDHKATGALLNLTLTRSYNSLDTSQSPFGQGWSTEFLLDYAVEFQADSSSRPIQPDETYRTALDLTYAPRGIVTFRTFSGSRHVFTTTTENEINDLRALTMPGWTLKRANIRSNWLLSQTDGLTYEFDRAGRLLSYGYPARGRMVDITYNYDVLSLDNGTHTAIISDQADLRQLELYYNAQHRIERSVLRDLTQSQTDQPCELTQNCYEHGYTYDDEGRLIQVDYAEGYQATYEYDANGYLITHDDLRASIAPQMTYEYVDDEVRTINIVADGGSVPWRAYGIPVENEEQRVITETDELGNTRTFTYQLDPQNTLRTAGNTYTLTSISSPLEGGQTVDALPTNFTWENGLLVRVNAKSLNGSGGRNSTVIQYRPDGQIQQISGGYIGVDITYNEASQPTVIRFADGTTQEYLYDDTFPVTFKDRQGASYSFDNSVTGQVLQRTRIDDGVQWQYRYNTLGLVTGVNQDGHEVSYDYDAFGRLTTINDPLLGDYTLTYERDESTDHYRLKTTITDETGVQQVRISDYNDLIHENHLLTNQGVIERETWTYDLFNRPTSHTVQVDDDDALVTTYAYSPLELLQRQPGDLDQRPVIRGYQVIVTDPYGRSTRYAYDALYRLRLVEDYLRHVDRYDYLYSDVREQNGLRILHNEIRANQLIASTNYFFDVNWQLRVVEQRRNFAEDAPLTYAWEFADENEPVNLRFLQTAGVGVSSIEWADYRNGQPTRINVNPADILLPSGDFPPSQTYGQTVDFLGRPLSITDGQGRTTQYAYCPLDAGSYQVIESLSEQDNLNCRSEQFARRLTYDIHDRLLAMEDASGIREFTYQRDAESQEWYVIVSFDAQYTWELRYNAAGHLLYWKDESGIERLYTHDMAGRLIAVTVEDAPEISYRFTYNAIGQVISQIDGLGRGTRYQYDERGLLIVQQNALTADVTTYAYGVLGEMRSITSPLGNTITFRYDNPSAPLQLTGVIDPSGTEHTFNWNTANRVLTVLDSRGNSIRYTFDVFGQLWLVESSNGENWAFDYDAAGALEGWQIGAVQAMQLDHTTNTLNIREANSPDWQWQFDFDANGLLSAVSPVEKSDLRLRYDALGRVNQLNTGGYNWALDYAIDDTLLTINGKQYDYDALYRLRGVQIDGTTVANYRYEQGRRSDLELTIETDATRQVTYASGDSSSQSRTVTIVADAQQVTYVYNAEGLIEEVLYVTCVESDVALCADDDASFFESSIRYVYDAEGRPFRIVDQEQNIETFAYDDIGNLVSYQSATGQTYTYQYDSHRRLRTITGPTGITVYLQTNALNRVTGLCRVRSEVVTNYAQCAEQGDVIMRLNYDALGRLTNYSYPDSNSTALITRSYASGLLDNQQLRVNRDTDEPIVEDMFRRSYGADALSLLERLQIGSNTHNLTYNDDLLLEGISGRGGVSYTHDLFGRIIGLSTNNASLSIDYLSERTGFTVTDTLDESALETRLNAQGFLSAYAYAEVLNAGEFDALMQVEYRVDRRDRDLLSVLVSSLEDTLALDMQFDRQNVTQNLVFNANENRLLADFVVTADGQPTRARFDGIPQTLFAEEVQGYIVVTGYNDAGRISTLRVNAKNDGRLLYVLSFTYNELGTPLTETRRFIDDTRININYEYNENNQLLRRTVEIVRGATNGVPTATNALGLLLLPFLYYLRKRRVVLMIGVLLIVGALIAPTTMAQRRGQVYTYFYSYDVAGNVISIDAGRGDIPVLDTSMTNCWNFEYDNANRLTLAQRNGKSFVYAYDARNQLVKANNWNLVNSGGQPLYASNVAGLSSFYGRIADRAPLFVTSRGSFNVFLPDGNDHLLGIADAMGEAPLLLLDPLARPIPLESLPTEDSGNVCQLIPRESNLYTIPQPLSTFKGMLWHAPADLYFRDGRVYLPEIGRFLQRDAQGPNVSGGLYDLAARETVPTSHREAPHIVTQVQRLSNALARTRQSSDLTADAIKSRYYPQLEPFSLWINQLATVAPANEMMQGYLQLPIWLKNHYNSAGVQIQDGGLRLDRRQLPGQGGTGIMSKAYQIPDDFEVPAIGDSLKTDISQLSGKTVYPVIVPRAYLPFNWQESSPDQLLIDRLAFSPSQVWQHLPLLDNSPDDRSQVLNAVATIQKLPEQTGADWLEMIFAEVLPRMPELPPEDAKAIQAQWFDDDTFGVKDTLQQVTDMPDDVTLPVYPIGANPDWIAP